MQFLNVDISISIISLLCKLVFIIDILAMHSFNNKVQIMLLVYLILYFLTILKFILPINVITHSEIFQLIYW